MAQGNHHDHHGHHMENGHHHNYETDLLNSTMNATLSTLANVVVTTASTIVSKMIPSTFDGSENTMDHSMHTHMPDIEGQMDHSMMMMPMYFQFSLESTILFKEWKTSTAGEMIGSAIGIVFMAILYEGLKFLREHLFRQFYSRMSYSTCAVTNISGSTNAQGAQLYKTAQNRMFGWPHILQTCLHITQVLLSYFLMLIFMTFNVYLCLAVLVGSGIGYFIFGWQKSSAVDISDHCH